MSTTTPHARARPRAIAGDLARSASEAARESSILTWVLACQLLALLLRAPYFVAALGIDEGGYSYIAQRWDSTEGSLYGAYWIDRPPLLMLAYRIAITAGDIGVRLLGATAVLAVIGLVALVAWRLAGDRAARYAALIAALLSASPAIHMVFSNAQVLGIVPATAAVVLLLYTPASRRPAAMLFAAGLFAAAALLVKQSFVDAPLAALAFGLACAHQRHACGFQLRWPAAFAAGLTLPLLLAHVWATTTAVGAAGFNYAMFGWRVDALHALQASRRPLLDRLWDLGPPAIESGIVVFAALGFVAAWQLRTRRIAAMTLAAWGGGALVGVLGGGSYWSHYLIHLVPFAAVGTGVVLASVQRRTAHRAVGVLGSIAVLTAAGATVLHMVQPHQHDVRTVAAYLRMNAEPGDTGYVLYARANVLYYSQLETPYPYLWSLMVQSVPGAEHDLRGLLASDDRPTWIVQWQKPTSFRLDQDGQTTELLREHYQEAATICGKPIYLRADRGPAGPPPAEPCVGNRFPTLAHVIERLS